MKQKVKEIARNVPIWSAPQIYNQINQGNEVKLRF